ncbi:MAG: stalk domain-containing protein [Defluviitaleaceae bacterium]|nr:stalk domain-containing protein [Defluviitaleaceae bacterium]
MKNKVKLTFISVGLMITIFIGGVFVGVPSPIEILADGVGDSITVTIDGVPIVFADQQPIIVDGRTLVPVRGVFEALGFEVDWEQSTQTARLVNERFRLDIAIGANAFMAVPLDSNGNMVQISRHHSIALDVPAQLINGRTMLPIRLPLEAVGYEVGWDDINRSVVISRSGNENTVVVQTPTQSETQPLQDQHAQSVIQQPPSRDMQQPYVDENVTNQSNPVTQSIPSHTYTRSAITLPDRRLTEDERATWIAEYHALGGANDIELEIVGLINKIRRENGLVELEICNNLMKAARFHAQTMNQHGQLSHTIGPYGSSGAVASAFGGIVNAANGAGVGFAEDIVERWMASESHRSNILNPRLRTIGVGCHRLSYMFLG